MEQTKLDSLLISEVSGVDDPANQLPGWMVTKSADGNAPDSSLVQAYEMEAFTKAAATKEPYGDVTYADPGYQADKKKRYPLDSEQHIRAAWSYINQGDNADLYSAEQLAEIKGKIKTAMAKIGAETESTTKAEGSDKIVARLRGIILGSPIEKGINVEKDELLAVLAERDETLVKSIGEAVAEAVSKSVVPAEGAGTDETVTEVVEAAPAIDAEALTKAAVEAAVAEVEKNYNEILEKALTRIETLEQRLGVAARKSLDGQEANGTTDEAVTKSTPDLGDAIAAAFRS